jgi:hypothetical protein
VSTSNDDGAFELRVQIATAHKHLEIFRGDVPDPAVHFSTCALCSRNFGELKAQGFNATSSYQRSIMSLLEPGVTHD